MTIETFELKDRTDPNKISISFLKEEYIQIIDEIFSLMRTDFSLEQKKVSSYLYEDNEKIIVKGLIPIERLIYYAQYNDWKSKNIHIWNDLWTEIIDQIFNHTWPMELPTYLDPKTNEVFFIGPHLPILTLDYDAGLYNIIFNIEKNNMIFVGRYFTENSLDFYYRNQVINIPKEMLESAQITPGDKINVWAYIEFV